MKGPASWPGRREAPIRCGYARTYEAGKVREAKTHPSLARRGREWRLDTSAPIEQTSRFSPKSGDGVLVPGLERRAAQDVVLGDLDGVEGEAAGRFAEQDGTGDDRRGSGRVESRNPLALLQGERREQVS